MVGDSAEARDAIRPLVGLATRLEWTRVPSILGPLVRQASTIRSHSLPERHRLRSRGIPGSPWWSIVYNGTGEARWSVVTLRSGRGVYTKHDCIVVVESAAISSTLRNKSMVDFFVSWRSLSMFTAAFRDALEADQK